MLAELVVVSATGGFRPSRSSSAAGPRCPRRSPVRSNQVEDFYGNGGLLGDHRAAPNWLHRQSSSQHPAPFRDRMPAEQGQLLALHLDQVYGGWFRVLIAAASSATSPNDSL